MIWKTVGRVSASEGHLETKVALQGKYGGGGGGGGGAIMPFLAKLSIVKDARRKFLKLRSVPFSLRENVVSELDQLEAEVVIENIYSEWETLIVAVPKRDGRLCMCGDYKVTVNPMLDVNQYLLPKPDDIFATLSGQLFTILDLSHMYNQLLLDED